MKTKLLNLRVEESVHIKIKLAAKAAHTSITDFLLGGAVLQMQKLAAKESSLDPLDMAFDELFRSGKVSKLDPEERAAVDAFHAARAKGTAKTVSVDVVLAELAAELDGGVTSTKGLTLHPYDASQVSKKDAKHTAGLLAADRAGNLSYRTLRRVKTKGPKRGPSGKRA